MGPLQMKYSLALMYALLTFLVTISAVSADEKDAISIAVVNVTHLMEKSPEAELASQALKDKFTPKELELAKEQDEITKLETTKARNRSLWTAEELRKADREIRSLKRDRARRLEDFREELRFARDSALDEVQKSVFLAIEEVRIERKIDIVIQEYVSASARVDLTPHVITHLKNKLSQQLDSQVKAENK